MISEVASPTDVQVAWLQNLSAATSAIPCLSRAIAQLAHQAQAQAVDRNANGVANYLEVVQAQEAVTGANDAYIASLYTAFNVAKPRARACDRALPKTRIKDLFDDWRNARKHSPRCAHHRSSLLRPARRVRSRHSTVAWRYAAHVESTDDAQIEGHLHAISARVTGTVLRINPDVQDNHFVKAGTLLLELDPGDFDAALASAEAGLTAKAAAADAAVSQVPIVKATAFSQLDLSRASEVEARANVAAAEADVAAAATHRVEHDAAVYARVERDRIRYEALVEKREISRSDYDARETDAKAAWETLEADRAAVASGKERVAIARSRVLERKADVDAARAAPERVSDVKARSANAEGQAQQARADVQTARLNVSYTRIYAPVSGIIGRKTVEIGHRIQPGQSLLIVVPVDDIWVTANFKETQVNRMRPGQAVRISVDAFDHDYQGTVDEMAGAVGTLFSLLPPENASGNFVKVVQRLPVRIRLNAGEDAEHRLRPGMSVEARVRVD